ncbi:MAG: hypothetical protein A2Y15_07550 [Clostridiales bacterium GWF2_36_10]|nr:MAG: hypothetical protein A2Y15_07550 [Clostridiales bacterium GWF2_36_10]
MKRVISIFLVIIMLLSVASCTKVPEESIVSNESTVFSEVSEEAPYEPYGTYQNGNLSTEEPNFKEDVKTIEDKGDGNLVYIDNPNGFKITLPAEKKLVPDFSISEASVSFKNDEVKIRISKENTGYNFIEFQEGYNGQHLESDEYLKNNSMVELRDKYCDKYNLTKQAYNGKQYDGYGKVGKYNAKFNFIKRTPVSSGSKETMLCYAYVTIFIGNGTFYTILINVTDFDIYNDFIQSVIDSFEIIPAKGTNIGCGTYKPVLPQWNEETAALYEKLRNQEGIAWGLFSPYSDQDYYHVNEIEEVIDFEFPVTMFYREMTSVFPLEELQRAYDERGQITELTLHLLSGGNGDDFNLNNTFGILDGKFDNSIKKWAKGLKEFGHPVLLRCSNEMNTTWCKYSGVQLMCDPDVYVRLWRHVYDIFKEEGVQNAIWIFNPFDNDFPPVNWNDMIAYYPGDEYVQMIGLTSYSSGDYYQYEDFRTFKQCYEPLVAKNRKYFSEFPWVIGEFGCSSVGGDKEQWIKDMFTYFPDYPEIKVAIWYSYADYDTRYNRVKIPARPLWLEEREEYLRAFAEGVKQNYAIKSLLN